MRDGSATAQLGDAGDIIESSTRGPCGRVGECFCAATYEQQQAFAVAIMVDFGSDCFARAQSGGGIGWWNGEECEDGREEW